MTGRLATVVNGGLTTVQDGGRRGLASVGVPRSGAWHRERYLLAGALATGHLDDRAAALEVLGGRLDLRVEVGTVLAVVGPAEVVCEHEAMPVGAALGAEPGSRWSVRWRGPGPVYVTLAGWRPDTVLGSAATDTFSRLGGAVVASGTELIGQVPLGWRDRVGAFLRPQPEERGPLRILAAGDPGLPDFVAADWSVRTTSRSGARLASGLPGRADSVPSSPTVPGAIQLTPSGEAIVLGPDGGITGGYPVVGVVAAVDRDRLSLLSPGDTVEFGVLDVQEAGQRYRQARDRLHRALVQVRTLA